MIHKLIFTVCFAFVLLSVGLTKGNHKRVDKEVKKFFSIEKYDLIAVEIDSKFTAELPSKFNDKNLFKIQANNSILGYAYIASAPSKTAEFDYLIFFDNEWVILKSSVLIYREEYGGEIGSKRWLKQFDGKKSSDELIYGDNIIAISGATISVKSMTNAVNNVLKSIKILRQNKQL